MLAEVAGFGMTADAGDIVAPEPRRRGAGDAGGLADAGMAAGEVGYINAHGTGTLVNDRAETRGDPGRFSAQRAPPVSSTKAMHGHAIGATGALEAMACLLALTEGMLPPTVGYQAADPDCALDVVPNDGAARRRSGRCCRMPLPSAGLNAVMAFRAA